MGNHRRETWAKWKKLVAEQRRSGMSAVEFCRERRVCASYFSVWKTRLSNSASEQFVPVRIVGGEEPVRTGGAIEVRLRGGERSLVVEPGFDATHLRLLLAVLETRS